MILYAHFDYLDTNGLATVNNPLILSIIERDKRNTKSGLYLDCEECTIESDYQDIELCSLESATLWQREGSCRWSVKFQDSVLSLFAPLPSLYRIVNTTLFSFVRSVLRISWKWEKTFILMYFFMFVDEFKLIVEANSGMQSNKGVSSQERDQRVDGREHSLRDGQDNCKQWRVGGMTSSWPC